MEAFDTGQYTTRIKNQILGDRILRKYQKIRDKINLDDLFDEVKRCMEAPINNLIKVTEGIKDKKNDLKYSIEMAEYVDNYGYTNHITKSNFQISIEPLNYIYANLMMSIDLRKKYDSVSQMDFIYYFEENGIVYYFNRFATKRILMFKGKEVLKAGAIKKFEDGSIMEVYKSYDEPKFRDNGTYDRMNMKTCGNLYTPYEKDGQTFWDVKNYQDMVSASPIRLKIVKSIIGSYFKKIFTNETEHLQKFLSEEKHLWQPILDNFPKI